MESVNAQHAKQIYHIKDINEHKNEINGNVWELHTEGQNCDKQ